MKNLKILILEGGFNEEHEVSLNTGNQVKLSLKRLNIKYNSIIVKPNTFIKEINEFSRDYLCFNALHGTFGEDGEIQKILNHFSFRFTHSDVKASYLGFNKKLIKKKFENTEIINPESLVADYTKINRLFLFNIFKKFGEFVIKPVNSGSSFGIHIFKNIEAIEFFCKNIENNLKLYKNHNQLLFEKFISGRELTVTVMEKNKKSFPVEVTEIVPKSEFFDYKSKYTPGYCKHILPARIPKNIYDNCKKNAKIIHDKINCKGISRSDFIYSNDKIYFLEINTHPGLTPISLAPEQLKYQDISFDDLVLSLLKSAL